MEGTPEKQPVRVTILSRPYTLLATGDPREIEAVAAKVVAEAAKKTGAVLRG